MTRLLLPVLFLVGCSFAQASDDPDPIAELRPDHDPVVTFEPMELPDLFADDLSVKIARAQIDADCMLADVQAEHDERKWKNSSMSVARTRVAGCESL